VLGLSPVRLFIVAIVGLILLGPDKLPQVARQAGSLWHTLRTLQQRVEDEIHEAVPDLPRSADLVRYARSPVSLLNQLADRASASNNHDAEAAAGEAAGEATGKTGDDVPEGHTVIDSAHPFELPDDDPPELPDLDRQPLAWGDPSLN
jgi:sec-independent protein translocase protein TatB